MELPPGAVEGYDRTIVYKYDVLQGARLGYRVTRTAMTETWTLISRLPDGKATNDCTEDERQLIAWFSKRLIMNPDHPNFGRMEFWLHDVPAVTDLLHKWNDLGDKDIASRIQFALQAADEAGLVAHVAVIINGGDHVWAPIAPMRGHRCVELFGHAQEANVVHGYVHEAALQTAKVSQQCTA